MFVSTRPVVLLTIFVIFVAALGVSGQSSTAFMPVSAVKEGMRGTARTVFNGTDSEEFNVEILGVVPGAVGPKQDMIVGRISGGKADRTGVFAGMSGSPVYIDGKLIGAISYSFPFSKEPMCGITPIEQMISIFEQQPLPAKAGEPRSLSFAEMASTEWLPMPGKSSVGNDPMVAMSSSGSMLSAVAGQSFRPIGTPMTFNGISAKVLEMFAPQLAQAGLYPVAAAGGSAAIGPMKTADATTLVGGDSVSMQMTRGDVSMAASGTVTFRDGDKIYAFGHPFLSLGSSDLPMSESSVVTVVPNVNNSFKLAVPESMVGTMTQDRATGVFGKLGQAPKMIPVKITLETSRGQREMLSFEVAKDTFLTPLLVNIGIANVLLAQERGLGDSMIAVDGEIKISNNETINVNRRFAGSQATGMAAGSIAAPVSLLFRNGFEGSEVESISVVLRSADGNRTAALERIAVDRTTVKPGETLQIQAFARTNTGKTLVQNIPLTIPADTPAGSFSIVIGDGASIERASAIQQFVPRTMSELVKTMNSLKLADRLYSQMFRTSTGAIIGSSEMSDLPPSMLATLNNDRASGGVKPAARTVIGETEIAPADFIIAGQQTLTIEIIK
jgi:SpoIVB peptidase S55.